MRIPKTRPFLIHSSALKLFLETKTNKRKSPCKNHEARCFKCKAPRTPKFGTGKAVHLPNGAIRFQGQCGTCNTKINKVIKGVEWAKKHPLKAYLSDVTKQHNRKHSTPLKCQLQGDSQLCLNLMP